MITSGIMFIVFYESTSRYIYIYPNGCLYYSGRAGFSGDYM